MKKTTLLIAFSLLHLLIYSSTTKAHDEFSGSSLCIGSFSGLYQGIDFPMSLKLTSTSSAGMVNASISFHGKTWTGAGTCVANGPQLVDINLSIKGAPNHFGSIYIDQNGKVIFEGTQVPGHDFVLIRSN